jgi:nitrilase
MHVAIVQTAATDDAAESLSRAWRLVRRMKPCDLVVFPEAFAIRTSSGAYAAAAEKLPGGPMTEFLAGTARRLGAWVAGGIIERAGRRVYNTCVVLDRAGRVRARYRKIHLFEATLDTGQVVRERDSYDAGREPVVVDIEGWRTGLAICYDVRFPELFRLYAEVGATLLLAPSNFTQRTGKDHWEVLLRARAIENQCYVVAPNQCGTNPVTGIASHGHGMVVDPWGRILCAAADSEGVRRATLDRTHLDRVRRHVPVLKHRTL